jgi:CRISPR-associated protein Csx10
LPAYSPPPLAQAVDPGAVFKRLTLVGGFDRTWGLPLEQRRALQAGSVFVFKVNKTIAAADLQQLCEQGLGERRAEGFGQVAINWHGQPAVLPVSDLKELIGDRMEPQPAADQQPIVLRGDSVRLAQRMNERLLRRQLDRQLAETVQSEACRVYHAPSKAQLSRLRSVALSALPSGDVARVKTFLTDDKLKARARDQFQLARIGRQRLLAWLRERVDKPGDIWAQLAAAQLQPPQVGSANADWKADTKLCNEYTLRLIEAVLHRAGKEQ